MFDMIIIGSGLGGLETAYILAKHGMNVCILERGHQLGGCLQTFKRKGTNFDTGFHYVGGMDEGRPLHRLFSYFNVDKLPWQRMDSDCFDEVCVDGQSYSFAIGHENFVRTLSEKFPDQKENLKMYDKALANVGEHIFDALKPRLAEDFYQNPNFSSSACDFLNTTITDETLQKVLSGTSIKLELEPSQLPFYIFAQINNSFIEGAYRLQGGGATLVDGFVKNLEKMGVTIIADADVCSLEAENGSITAAVTTDGQRFEAKNFISDAHPAATLAMVSEEAGLRKVYRNRINRMENTFGMFTVNLDIKAEAMPYLNKNLFIYENSNPWSINKDGKIDGLLVNYACTTDKQKFASAIDLLTPMRYTEVEQWADTKIGRRGADYESFKKAKAEQCIELASKRLPELKESIQNIYTSTPLTYRDYTKTSQGSAYGLRKDFNNTMLTFLPPRTPVQNLYLTGQNLNLHGILGVSMTSFVSASALIGLDCATEGLNMD